MGYSFRENHEEIQILTIMKSGDIWIVDIPELGTHEQSGMTKVLVVSKRERNNDFPLIRLDFILYRAK